MVKYICFKNKNMKKFIKLLFIFSINLINFSSLFSSSWKTFMFDETRKGAKYEVVISSNMPQQSWKIDIQGEVITSSVVKDDIVYFTSRDGSIWAVDGHKGEILWQYSTSGKIDFTAVLWKDYVYVGSYDGKIYCFKRYYEEFEDFVPLWSYDTESKIVSSAIVVEDEDVVGYESNPWIIFVSGPKINGITRGKLYILDALNGKEVKSLDLGSFSYSSLSYSENKIYFTTNDGFLQCYDLKQQKFLWQKKFASCLNHTSVAIKENNIFVYVGDVERKVYMIDKNNGEILWSSQHLSSLATNNTSVTLYEDKIFVNIYPTSVWKQDYGIVWSSQTVVCISTTTGILWRKDILVKNSPKESYNITSAVSVVSDTAYFGTYSGELFVLNIYTAEEIAKYSFESPILCSVAISNGWIYFSEVKGNLYGIKAEKFLAIKQPDFDDIVINTSTIVVLSSNFNKDVSVEISANNENLVISTISLTNQNTIFFDTRSLLDGKYQLKLKDINSTKIYAVNNINIDNSPLPPTNLTAFSYEPNKIYLTWTKSYDDSSGNNDVRKYKIYRSLDGQNYNFIAEVSKGTNFYIDLVTVSSTYYYTLTAKDKYTESVFSSPAKLFVETEKVTEDKTEEGFLVKSGSECVIEYSYNGRKLELYFEKTSLNNDLRIIISMPTEYDKNFPKGVKFTSLVYKFYPEDVKFNSKVKLRIYYKDEDVLSLKEERLRIYWYNKEKRIWYMLNSSLVNKEKNYVEAEVYHFSLYALAEYSSLSNDIFKEEYVYAVPSPAKGNEVYFKFFLYKKAELKVYVYDVAGDLVWQSSIYNYTDKDIGKTHMIKWNIENVATGIYIFKVEGKDETNKQSVIKKFSVIH